MAGKKKKRYKRTVFTSETKATLLAALASGVTVRALAKRHGVKEQTLHAWRRRGVTERTLIAEPRGGGPVIGVKLVGLAAVVQAEVRAALPALVRAEMERLFVKGVG